MDCWAGDVLGDSQERSQTITSFFRDQQVYWTVHLCFYSNMKRSGNIPWGFFLQLSWIYSNIMVPGTSNMKISYKWWRLKLKKPFTYTEKHLLTILEFLISLWYEWEISILLFWIPMINAWEHWGQIIWALNVQHFLHFIDQKVIHSLINALTNNNDLKYVHGEQSVGLCAPCVLRSNKVINENGSILYHRLIHVDDEMMKHFKHHYVHFEPKINLFVGLLMSHWFNDDGQLLASLGTF